MALDGAGSYRHAPTASAPEITRYPMYWRMGGPYSTSGPVWKNLALHRNSIPGPISP